MKLYIVSNRLPVKVSWGPEKEILFSRSEGGLATGLDSLKLSEEKHWIGWPGVCTERKEEKDEIRRQLEAMNFHPVFLSDAQYEYYYEGYSNSTIWPLCHYFYAYTQYEQNFWSYYKEANALFCEEVCKIVLSNRWVWIHKVVEIKQMDCTKGIKICRILQECKT